MSDEATRILNWMDDDYGMEITEGVRFDPEIEYTFEISDIKRKAGEKDGKPWLSCVCGRARVPCSLGSMSCR